MNHTLPVVLAGLLVAAFPSVASNAFAARKGGTPPTAPTDVLSTGRYSAQVKALVCEGCGPFIKETLEQNPAIEKVSINQATRTLSFTVRRNAKVMLADLQKSLLNASEQMGMGADYSLSGLHVISNQ